MWYIMQISQLCKGADNLGMMIYGSEKNDVEVIKQTGTDLANLLKALEEVVQGIRWECNSQREEPATNR